MLFSSSAVTYSAVISTDVTAVISSAETSSAVIGCAVILVLLFPSAVISCDV